MCRIKYKNILEQYTEKKWKVKSNVSRLCRDTTSTEKDTVEFEGSRPLFSPFGRKDTCEVEGIFTDEILQKIFGEIFLKKIFRKKSGKIFLKGNFGGEIIGRSGGKKNLRHTDGVGRGNVGSMKNGREMNLGSERNWSGSWKERWELRNGGTTEGGFMGESAVKERKNGFRVCGRYLPYLHTYLGGYTTSNWLA